MTLLLLSALSISASGILPTDTANAEARALSGPSTREEARQRAEYVCNNEGGIVGFGAWPSNINFNESTGNITYTMNVTWRSCNGVDNTAYALTGYPTNGLAICPAAGDYYAGSQYDPQTYDCVKYVGNPAYGFRSQYLRCERDGRWGSFNDRCFSAVGMSAVRAGEDRPSQNWTERSYNLSGSVPSNEWAVRSSSSGSWDFGGYGALCQFYKAEVNGWSGQGNLNCQNFIIRASWTRLNFNLEPTITAAPSAGEYDTVVSINASVTNSGSTSSTPADWSIRRVIVKPGGSINGLATNNKTAEAYFGGEEIVAKSQVFGTNSTDLSSNIPEQRLPDEPVGTLICYTLSVAPFRHDDSGRRHSDPACVTIAKRPKVQVIGGDLFVGRQQQGVSPISARVITSNTRNPSGLFGSWGEYAVAATGPITSMGSAAGYVGGANASATLLAFTNQVSATSCSGSVGCYDFKNNPLPDVGQRFAVGPSSPGFGSGTLTGLASGTYKAANAATITIAASTIGLGQSVILNVPDNDVIITGNITYTNGPITSAAAIPQVLIIARNITIADAVTQVDSWLISPGKVNAGTVTNGVIRTCQTPAASITAGVCNTKLQVNGPVVANRLIMLRTAGSGPGKDAGDPAEVFNTRPDAYLWALNHLQNNGRITSVETKELPPRY